MAEIDKEILDTAAINLKFLIRYIAAIPSCHYTHIVPEWEAQRLLEIAAYLDIDISEYGDTLDYTAAMRLKRDIMAELGDIFRRKGDIGLTRLEELRALIFNMEEGGDNNGEKEV